MSALKLIRNIISTAAREISAVRTRTSFERLTMKRAMGSTLPFNTRRNAVAPTYAAHPASSPIGNVGTQDLLWDRVTIGWSDERTLSLCVRFRSAP